MHCETRDPVISSSSLQGPHEHAAAKHDRPTRKPPCLLVQRGDHHLYGGFAPRRLLALCSCCKNPTALICTRAEEQWEGRLETQHLPCAGRRMQPVGEHPCSQAVSLREMAPIPEGSRPSADPTTSSKSQWGLPSTNPSRCEEHTMLCSPGASVPVDY